MKKSKRPDSTAANTPSQPASSAGAYWFCELDDAGETTVYQFSPAIEQITGFKADYFSDGFKQWLGVVYPEDRQRVFDFLSKLMRTQGEGSLEFRIMRPDGILRWVLDCATSIRLPDNSMRLDGSVSDITERKQAEDMLRQSNMQLGIWINELQQRKNKMELLENIGKALQSCARLEDVKDVLVKYTAEVFPDQPGALYLYDSVSDRLKREVAWNLYEGDIDFPANFCLAWRDSQAHISPGSGSQYACKHDRTSLKENQLYLCAPLVAQGERIGVLYLRRPINDFEGKEAYDSVEFWKSLVMMVVDRLAFVILNLKLRHDLLNQSLRDPLTGLFTRRYFEEALQGELRRAQRHQRSVGVMLMQMDRLDDISETMGTAAVNVALQSFGKFVSSQVRSSDVPCRFTENEFAVLLAEASLEDAFHRAEVLRMSGENQRIFFNGRLLKAITLSIGVAAFPKHGDEVEILMDAAQQALSTAIEKGRNYVVMANGSVH
ncbi:MAG: diguanylate cyclase [Anaerolineae bacterium]|nr:diguanylate cyclase [Anaerolineae bacterium]